MELCGADERGLLRHDNQEVEPGWLGQGSRQANIEVPCNLCQALIVVEINVCKTVPANTWSSCGPCSMSSTL